MSNKTAGRNENGSKSPKLTRFNANFQILTGRGNSDFRHTSFSGYFPCRLAGKPAFDKTAADGGFNIRRHLFCRFNSPSPWKFLFRITEKSKLTAHYPDFHKIDSNADFV